MLKTTGLLKRLVHLGLGLVLLTASVSLAKAAPDAPDAAGDLDLTFAGFGVGGKVITTGVPMLDLKRGMALQPDGKIVVAGDTVSGLLVMRYHPNGTLDTTFDGDGKATPDLGQLTRRGTSVAIQADGKIVVAGWADMQTLGTNYDFLLVRLTPTGALDTTLDGDGFVTTDILDDYDVAQAVLIQPDGKIVAAGRAFVGGHYEMAVARYNADGLPDATFGGGDGQMTTDFGGDYEEAYDIALQTANKLVLVGDHHSGPNDGDFSVARLNSNGTPDASFDGNGLLITDLGDDETARAVVIQPDGNIVVAGYSGSAVKAARYLTNGALDNSFDNDGKLTLAILDGGIQDAALQPDGRIVLLGYHQFAGQNDFAFYRLNSDGALDSTFGGAGVRLVDVFGEDYGSAVALQADGRILAYGSAAESDHALVRLWPDGTLDAGGRQTLGIDDPQFGPGSDEIGSGLALQADGKIVVVGAIFNAAHTESDVALARFLPDGRPDTSFGAQGHALCCLGAEVGKAVVVQPDGKIVVAGYYVNEPVTNFMVARFNANGTLDDTFESNGVQRLDFLGGDDYGTAVALAPGGKIVVAGTVFNGARDVFGVARFNGDGTVDNTFDNDGRQLLEFVVGLEHVANAVVVQPDGKIVVGGTVGGDFALARFNEDGTVDGTFGLSGLMRTDMGGSDSLDALVLLPSGWFVAAGRRVVGSNGDFALAEYRPNGALGGCPPFPCSVWSTGKAFVNWGNVDAAFAIDWRSDGTVVAAGCADGQFAWARLRTNTAVPVPITGTTNFAGVSECAYGVKFGGLGQIVTAGAQNFNGDSNFALARFGTVLKVFLPSVRR